MFPCSNLHFQPRVQKHRLKKKQDSIVELRKSTSSGCVRVTLEVVEEAPNPLVCGGKTVCSPCCTRALA
ncbi:hypothetical protein E2C01_029067 [Portunus trituberculatus]|uniref:Uncharacterized protein n=1 Tax=Portunus trituberculatus TaxID=210409 RepID=A0A5B7EME5_PORTR|nr:hypothetical protein [Portunus trituberculatus]